MSTYKEKSLAFWILVFNNRIDAKDALSEMEYCMEQFSFAMFNLQ
jgi:hypothetical protein